jgi:hypothetical protein
MVAKASLDADFVHLFETYGPAETARRVGTTTKNVHLRRRNMERLLKRAINPPDTPWAGNGAPFKYEEHPARISWEIKDGVVLVGSDAHYWPGVVTTAHKAFVRFAKEFKPWGTIFNGDVSDGASISRHPPIGWEHIPPLVLEVDASKERLGEVEAASPDSKRAWTLGNHDARYNTRLATVAPQYANIKGTQLKDHFPGWQPCWSVWINDSVVIKHRFKSGTHATHNNTMWAGKSIVTGHLHSLKVTPLTDYNGSRYGVDCGTLAEPYGPQFNYAEDNPVNWRSGFAVLTFQNSRLLWPEVVYVRGEGEVEFRGKVIQV